MASPIVITAALAAPLVDSGDPIHLDGILALAWARRHRQHSGADRRMLAAEVADPHLPLVRVGECWAATAGFLSDDQAPAAVWQTRRRDPDDWDALDRPANTTAGPGKDILMRRSARTASRMTWLAWGQRREVVASLRLLWGSPAAPYGFLGSARRSGSGELAAWSVTRGDHGVRDCFVRDGQAMRHLPHAWLSSCSRYRVGAFRPPYWMPAHRDRVSSVGASVELTDKASAAIAAADAEESRRLATGDHAR